MDYHGGGKMMYAGLDTHKDSVFLHMIDGRGHIVENKRFLTDDFGLKRLAKTVAKAKCVMEAGSTCYPIYDALTEQGVVVKVAHPSLLKSISGSKKTDKVDAAKMAVMLKADAIPGIHVPTVDVRMKRDLVRQHISLTQQRTAEINRLKALMLRYRIKPAATNLFGKRANWPSSGDIREDLKPLLQQSLDAIRSLKSQCDEIDALIEQQAMKNDDAVLLHSIPGVGWFTAYLVAVTIDGIERFPSPEQLVSYAGLAPRVHQSGNTCYRGPISKCGRPELRWALGQCAWSAIRMSKRFHRRFAKLSRKHGRQKAITATARKLLTIMYYMLKRREVYNEDV